MSAYVPAYADKLLHVFFVAVCMNPFLRVIQSFQKRLFGVQLVLNIVLFAVIILMQ